MQPLEFDVIEGILVVLLSALVTMTIFRKIKLPVILGYLLVGILVGPHVLGWLPDSPHIDDLAEFGVVFLMFTVGLEFSLPKLLSLKRAVFLLGSLQVVLCLTITVLVGIMLGMTLIASFVVGAIVAMSSTAIVLKQVADQSQLNTQHGKNAVGILLFQDLAVIPVLVIIGSLSSSGEQAIGSTLQWGLLKGILGIIAILLIGKWLLAKIFRVIASLQVTELFTLSVLFVSVGAAWLTNALGLSYALGAFVAGMMLGESEFRHQIKVEIRPFRDVLLGLFFISIGMLVNVTIWPQTWLWITLLLSALMMGKMLLIVTLSIAFKYNLTTSIRTGLILAQGGEFGFAILTLALSNQLLPPDWGQAVLAALLISLTLAPIIIQHNEKLIELMLPKAVKRNHKQVVSKVTEASSLLENHVIVCGYGRVGQNIAKFLQKVKCPYIGLEYDEKLVRNAKLIGDEVTYADATHPEILTAAKLESAKAVVISFDDVHAATNIVEHIRSIDKKIPILVRVKDEPEFEQLKACGATKVVTEIFEESLTMAHHLLQLLQIPKKTIDDLLQNVRDKNYALLSEVFPSAYGEEQSNVSHEYLRPVVLTETAYAVGHALADIKLNNEVNIVEVRRGRARHLNPKQSTQLLAKDVIVLYASPKQLDLAERQLLAGNKTIMQRIKWLK